jgi:hypothetical protein
VIDGIRRKLGKAAASDPWGADEELEPEIAEDAAPPGGIAGFVTVSGATGKYVPDDPSAPDYYKSLVRTALENGGRHGLQSISIPWLRMILAGLESKQIDPEMMWYGMEAGETRREPMPEIPPYEDLFQAGQDS